MNKKILSFLLLTFIFGIPSLVLAAPAACGVTTGGPSELLTGITGKLTDAANVVGASLAVIGFIVAGILFVTAGGGDRMKTAKSALIAAVIGTAVLALAQGSKVMTQIFCLIFQ